MESLKFVGLCLGQNFLFFFLFGESHSSCASRALSNHPYGFMIQSLVSNANFPALFWKKIPSISFRANLNKMRIFFPQFTIKVSNMIYTVDQDLSHSGKKNLSLHQPHLLIIILSSDGCCHRCTDFFAKTFQIVLWEMWTWSGLSFGEFKIKIELPVNGWHFVS